MVFEALHGMAGYKRRAYRDVSDLDWDILKGENKERANYQTNPL